MYSDVVAFGSDELRRPQRKEPSDHLHCMDARLPKSNSNDSSWHNLRIAFCFHERAPSHQLFKSIIDVDEGSCEFLKLQQR